MTVGVNSTITRLKSVAYKLNFTRNMKCLLNTSGLRLWSVISIYSSNIWKSNDCFHFNRATQTEKKWRKWKRYCDVSASFFLVCFIILHNFWLVVFAWKLRCFVRWLTLHGFSTYRKLFSFEIYLNKRIFIS